MKDLMPKIMKFAGAVAVIVVAFYVYDWMQERKAQKVAEGTVAPSDIEVA